MMNITNKLVYRLSLATIVGFTASLTITLPALSQSRQSGGTGGENSTTGGSVTTSSDSTPAASISAIEGAGFDGGLTFSSDPGTGTVTSKSLSGEFIVDPEIIGFDSGSFGDPITGSESNTGASGNISSEGELSGVNPNLEGNESASSSDSAGSSSQGVQLTANEVARLLEEDLNRSLNELAAAESEEGIANSEGLARRSSDGNPRRIVRRSSLSRLNCPCGTPAPEKVEKVQHYQQEVAKKIEQSIRFIDFMQENQDRQEQRIW